MGKDHGKEIGDIFKKAFQSGDLSRLKDLGPAVQEAVKEIPGMASSGLSGASAAPRQAAAPAQARPMWQGQGARGAMLPKIPGGMAMIVLGIMGIITFGLLGIAFAVASSVFFLQPFFGPLGAAFGGLGIGCAALTAAGFSKRNFASRLKVIYSLFEHKKVYTFEELAAIVGREPAAIRKDIRKAKKKGLLPDVRMDAGENCLMQGEEAYQLYLQSERTRQNRLAEENERQRRASDPATAPLEAFRLEGESTIRKIRLANDAIPGEEISEKLDKLEGATGRIVAYVQKVPAKLPDTRKFMDYYLPTTLKLVETYRQYEELDVQPESVKAAKLEIERALDTINLAFENLFDSLHEHETLDVATDIAVLEKMLEQEGLTGKQFDIGGTNA